MACALDDNALDDILKALHHMAPRINRVVVVGGGARLKMWRPLLTRLPGLPTAAPAVGDFGAAFGAACAVVDAVCRKPVSGRACESVDGLPLEFESAYDRFRSLYQPLTAR